VTLGNADEAPSSGHNGSAPCDQSAKLMELMAKLESGELDKAVEAIETRRRHLAWARLPDRIVLLRHGESEGNVNQMAYASRGDSLLELTSKGILQAQEAGGRLLKMLENDKIFVCVSPFERTQQTLLALYHHRNPVTSKSLEHNVVGVHVDSRIREQEFGNFQTPGLRAAVRAEEKLVGRFYYRRPNAESSADVFDRVSQFWDCLLSTGNDSLLSGFEEARCCLVVTHGLTIRLLLMKIFHWSVETYETVWNMGNCHHITLRKNAAKRQYDVCLRESFPNRIPIPWATREIWLVMKEPKEGSSDTEKRLKELERFQNSEQCKGLARTVSSELFEEEDEELQKLGPHIKPFTAQAVEISGIWPEIDRAIDGLRAQRMRERSKPYTVVDYISIPQPRTTNREALKGRLVPGHGLHDIFTPETLREKGFRDMTPAELLQQKALEHQNDVEMKDVERVDWWGDSISHQAKTLRWQTQKHIMSGDDFKSPRQLQRHDKHHYTWGNVMCNATRTPKQELRTSSTVPLDTSERPPDRLDSYPYGDSYPYDDPYGDGPTSSHGTTSMSMGLRSA